MSKPEFVDIVQSGIKIQQDLSAARLAQAQQQQKAKRDESQKLTEEKERERIQFVNERARVTAELQAVLEQFHPEELLTQVNNTQDVWRGVGVIKKRPATTERLAYTLVARYKAYYTEVEDEGRIRNNKLGEFETSLEIGVDNKYFKKYADGRFYHGGTGLYVQDLDAPLCPVAPADKFKDLVPKGLREDLGDSYPPQIVIFDIDHPQASDMLTEILARSCINRVSWGKEPWKRVGDSTAEIRLPTPNRSWWSRIFG